MSSASRIQHFYPKSSREFSEAQLEQHMRIPGAIWQPRAAHPRRRAALVGVRYSKQNRYSTVFFGAPRAWANDEEGWEQVQPRIRARQGWKGSKAEAMEH
jgi:hypothetical protein